VPGTRPQTLMQTRRVGDEARTGSGGGADAPEVLLLACDPRSNAVTISDHIRAIEELSRHRVWVVRRVHPFGGVLPRRLKLDRFDALILHYSLYLLDDVYLTQAARRRVAEFGGVKILLIQDEYRQVNAMKQVIRELGIDVLFTCIPGAEMEKVYPSSELPGLVKVNTLTGYVPADLSKRKVRPLRERPIDVGYRARKLPYWLGELGVEKWRIVPGFLAAVEGQGFVCDLSYQEADRIYGERWIEFIASCKTMLGVESGASVFDFTGEIQRNVDAYVAAHPNATFDEVRDLFFAREEGRIRLNQISPRCFEAAALRTAMVLFEGEYSGILKPWRHYVPLKKDFSNIGEVIAALRDVDGLQKIAETAYREVALDERYSYAPFVKQLDDALSRAYDAKHPKVREGISKADDVTPTRWSRRYSRLTFYIASRPTLIQAVLGVLATLWQSLPDHAQERLRDVARPVRKALERTL